MGVRVAFPGRIRCRIDVGQLGRYMKGTRRSDTTHQPSSSCAWIEREIQKVAMLAALSLEQCRGPGAQAKTSHRKEHITKSEGCKSNDDDDMCSERACGPGHRVGADVSWYLQIRCLQDEMISDGWLWYFFARRSQSSCSFVWSQTCSRYVSCFGAAVVDSGCTSAVRHCPGPPPSSTGCQDRALSKNEAAQCNLRGLRDVRGLRRM